MNRRTLSALALAVAAAAVAAVGIQHAYADTVTPAAGAASTRGAATSARGDAPFAPVPDTAPIPQDSGSTPIPPGSGSTPVPPGPGTTPIPPSSDGTTTQAGRGGTTTLRDAGPATGLLQGHLYGVGGMAPGTRVTWSGSVTVTGKGVHQVIAVGANGAFALMLDPGVYTVTGNSPAHLGPVTCTAGRAATIVVGRRVTVDVECPIP